MLGKVLIVDDSPDILTLLRTNLRAAGFETTEATNGRAALQQIDEDRPDVILLDLMMPVLDGWGVLERLRGRRDLPAIIVISALDSPSYVDRAHELGATAFVTKPLNLTALIDLVRSATGDPAEGRAASRSGRPGPG